MFILNLGHSFTCSAVLSVCVQIPFVGHLRALYNLYLIEYGPTFNSLAELTVAHSTSVPSPQVCTSPCNFLVTTDYCINLLNTKRNLLYIRNQIVPRSKHFPPQL